MRGALSQGLHLTECAETEQVECEPPLAAISLSRSAMELAPEEEWPVQQLVP